MLQIVLAEDDEDQRDVLGEALRDIHGANVWSVNNAGDAYKAIQASNFDVLISDIGMPDEDGYSLIKRIRKLPLLGGGGIIAVALSGYCAKRDVDRILDAGFQYQYSKPLDLDSLAAMIAKVIKYLHLEE